MMEKSEKMGSTWNTSKTVFNSHPHIEGNEDCSGSESQNGYRTYPVRQTKPPHCTYILNSYPPILEVSKLKTPGAVEVYALLYESAYKDRCYDKRKHLPWSERSDFGGMTEWSIKGIASQLSLGKVKVNRAVDALLNAGFITVFAFIPSGNGSKKRLFRVTHYSQLENVRHALEIMSKPFGLTTSPIPNAELGEDVFAKGVFTDDQEDWFEFLSTDYDPEFNGLHEGDYITNFNERKQRYLESPNYTCQHKP